MNNVKHNGLQRIIPSHPTHDGDGVKLRRSLGAQANLRLDPFLMLDEFYSDNPDDYIGGFPAHPHRGFETVTYMLDGHMQHKDHMGNTGDLGPGDVQWMTAGRGVIHSEMPQQSEGRMRGFQLWLNLAGKDKMQPAAYRDIRAEETEALNNGKGSSVRAIAGNASINLDGESLSLSGPLQRETTEPLYLDVALAAGAEATLELQKNSNVVLYPYEGSVTDAVSSKVIPQQAAGLFEDVATLSIRNTESETTRLLVIAGQPLHETVVQYGPFVMNSSEEINQALRDYRDGTLTAAAS